MNRRIVLVTVILLSFFSSLLAQTIPQLPLNPFLVYGPKKFERSTQTITGQFTLPPTARSPYTLYVANGWLDGSKRVTSAVIKINGVTVVDQNDFKKKLPVIIKTVSLNTNNQIEITLNGQTGSFIILAITATDKNPPKITITNPMDNFVTRQPSITCTGIVTDETFATLTINGKLVLPGSGGTFSKTVQITEGTNTITFVARDLWGNTARETRTVIKDTQPPMLTVVSPQNGQVVSSAMVQVSGTVTDASPVIVTANGIPLTVMSNGSFSGEVPLDANIDTIRITATDGAQNQTTVTRIVQRASSAPVLTLTSPVDSSLTKENTITVQGTVMDSGSVVLRVNGNTISVLPDGSFSAAVALAEGVNHITVIATNGFGQSTTVVRTVRKDSTPPLLTIISPIENLITRDSVLIVQGTAFDSVGITLKVNGDTVTVGADGSWSKQITLMEGQTTISIVATDIAGNATTVTRHVRCDTQPPILTIISPIENLITRDSVLLVQGTAFDSVAIALTVNGDTAAIGTDGAWSKQITLMEGQTTILIVVTDAAGNVTSITRHITRDTQPPVLTIISPIENLITGDSVLLVQGTAFDSTMIALTVNGDTVAIGADGAWSKQITLHEGQTTISIVVTDVAGNSTTVVRTVTRSGEILPPDPATVAPPLDQTVATTMFAATEFLYTGPNPIQTGVAPGTIDAIRVAVLRGKVMTRDNQPLPGVKITVLNHTEYGQTLSRADGMFDIAANGGGYLTIDYKKNGYLPVQRQVSAPLQDYAIMDTVVMIQLDTVATIVDFSESIQISKGSIEVDKDGQRQIVLMFKQSTQATMTLPDGSTQVLDSIHVRATEYTVGPNGPKSMPALLPPATAYTYCVELSVDEAIAAGAKKVEFSQPVVSYLDNFLNFPTGTIIPVGWYDRERGVWVPAKDGRVVTIVGIDTGKAQLDWDGDGLGENQAKLDSIGVTSEEQSQLAFLYPVGKNLWRAEISHFSPHDMNLPYKLPANAKKPDATKPEKNDPDKDKDKKECSSIIDVQSQGLGEAVPITGTPFSLYYQSKRTPGYKAVVDIPLSNSNLPSSVKRIELVIRIAGKIISKTYPAQNNLTHRLVWDKKDAYGRDMNFEENAQINIGYVYDALYDAPYSRATAAVFDQYGSDVTLSLARLEFTLWQRWDIPIGGYNVPRKELGGWSLNTRHAYSLKNKMLYFGNGEKNTRKWIANVINQIPGFVDTLYYTNYSIGAGNDGVLYVGDSKKAVIYKVNVDGQKTIIAGTGVPGLSGDGGSAKEAQIGYAASLKEASDGSLYFIDYGCLRVRRIDTQGIITTVAGNGQFDAGGGGGAGKISEVPQNKNFMNPRLSKMLKDRRDLLTPQFKKNAKDNNVNSMSVPVHVMDLRDVNDEGKIATEVPIFPSDVEVGSDGGIYILEVSGLIDDSLSRIRKVGTDGTICTIAGNGSLSNNGDGVPALSASLGIPLSISLGPDGTIYLGNMAYYYTGDTTSGNHIRCITPDGIIHRVLGLDDPSDYSGYYYNGDGHTALETMIASPANVKVAGDGTIYFVDVYNNMIRKITPEGIVITVAGNRTEGDGGDGGNALDAQLAYPTELAVAPDGTIYTTQTGYGDPRLVYIRKISEAMPGFNGNDIHVASPDGSELYVFSPVGKHICTLNGLTLDTLYNFVYNSEGLLLKVIDKDSLVTTIQRDEQGNPISILSPFGQVTQLQIDATGYLRAVTNPGGETTRMDYDSTGLMTNYYDPKNNRNHFIYDDDGLLILDSDPAGGYKELTRAGRRNGYDVTVTSALGQKTKYTTEYLSSGDVQSTIFESGVFASQSTTYKNGMTIDSSRTGMKTTMEYKPDPRYGITVPIIKKMTVETPGGLQSETSQGRIITRMEGLRIKELVDTLTVNGRSSVSVYDDDNKVLFRTSPEGRQRLSFFNGKGRVIKDSIPGLSAMNYTYDSRGFLITSSQADRTILFSYDTRGRLAAITDPVGRTMSMQYDSVGRVVQQTLPDENNILYRYDLNGNLASLTPPGKPAHTFDYTSVDLTSKYVPPVLGTDTTATRYLYNLDKRLTDILRPDSLNIHIEYDTAGCGCSMGRIVSILYDRGSKIYTYDSTTGLLRRIDAPSGNSLHYLYDGSIPVRTSWQGEVNGSIDVRYDNDFKIVSRVINDIDSVEYQYDRDGLMTQVGSLAISRDSLTGRIAGTTLENVTTSQSLDSLGQLESYQATSNGSIVFNTIYERDSLGKIERLTETIQGVTNSYRYGYDPVGRLENVWRQIGGSDSLISVYCYDTNGNRIAHTTHTKVDSGLYDAQDRILRYSDVLYYNTANGGICLKVEGADTTRYTYDAFGNLMMVVLPSKDVIEYIIDGQNRRIGRKVNGIVTNRWLYAGQLHPIAELDSAGNIIAAYHRYYLEKENVTYRIIRDHLGSIRLIVNTQTGDVAQRLDYDEWGNVVFNSNPEFQSFGFGGGLFDPLTNLVRFGVRDYDAGLGRWMTKDPVRFAGGLNFMTYSKNDPINSVDISGLFVIHTSDAECGQEERLRKAIEIIKDKLKNNKSVRAYFQKFGIDIDNILQDGEGPDVYLQKDASDAYGYYNWLTNNVVLSDMNDVNMIAATVIHEAAHWANDVSDWWGDLDPDLADVPPFVNPNPKDGPYGYAAEFLLFGYIQ